MTDETKKPAAAKADPVAAKPADVETDPSVLSPADLEKIRADAKAKVAKEIRQSAIKAAMEEMEAEERIAAGLAPKVGAAPVAEEEMMHVTISLPVFCVEGINLDGKRYMHGHTYRVSPSLYVTLVDQMQMSWHHEDQKDGKFTNFNRRERDTHIRHGAPINAPMALNTRTGLMH